MILRLNFSKRRLVSSYWRGLELPVNQGALFVVHVCLLLVQIVAVHVQSFNGCGALRGDA
jgi:hypothetical protein